jgi:hypothetical protein
MNDLENRVLSRRNARQLSAEEYSEDTGGRQDSSDATPQYPFSP